MSDAQSLRKRPIAPLPNARDQPREDIDTLDQTAAELRRRGVRLLLARDVGAVRNVLRRGGAETILADTHPTVRAVVSAAKR